MQIPIAITELSDKYRCWLSSVFLVVIGSRSKQQDQSMFTSFTVEELNRNFQTPDPMGIKMSFISHEAISIYCFATAPAVRHYFSALKLTL